MTRTRIIPGRTMYPLASARAPLRLAASPSRTNLNYKLTRNSVENQKSQTHYYGFKSFLFERSETKGRGSQRPAAVQLA
jgi:hypothetical protein